MANIPWVLWNQQLFPPAQIAQRLGEILDREIPDDLIHELLLLGPEPPTSEVDRYSEINQAAAKILVSEWIDELPEIHAATSMKFSNMFGYPELAEIYGLASTLCPVDKPRLDPLFEVIARRFFDQYGIRPPVLLGAA